MNQLAADAGSLAPGFRGSARLASGAEFLRELRILNGAVFDISSEAAVAEYNGSAGGDELHLPRFGLREAVALTNLNAFHTAVGIPNDAFQIGAGARFYPKRFKLGSFLEDNAGTGAVFNNGAARHGMTAFLRHALLDPFNAERLDGPLPGWERLFAEVPHFFGLVESAPFGHHVFGHEFRRVFQAFFFLHGCSRNAHDAAVNDGIAADDAHLLQYADRSAGQPSFNSGGKTGKPGTDDDNIERFIPLFGHRIKSFGRSR